MSLASRREIIRVCRRLYGQGLIAGSEGNVSLRLGSARVLITPRGVSKGELVLDDLVEVSLSGDHLRGGRRASTEAVVHLEIYSRREDVEGIVHAHPPTATGFATAGLTVPDDALPEVTFGLGPVILVPYARPGTYELARRVGEAAVAHDVLLLANHGAVTAGASLAVAHQRMESLEHAARIVFVARLLGGHTRLSTAEVAALAAERRTASQAARPGRAAGSSSGRVR